MSDTMRQWLPRICIGGAVGVGCYILIATFFGNLDLFGSFSIDRIYFSMSTSSFSPQWLETALDYLLWFAFGAEVGIATLPFDDRGLALALKSLLHYGVMMLTVGLWAFLDFCHPNHMGVFFRADLWDFLLPVSIIYAVVWGVRWLGWYFELGAIRRKLGLNKKKGGKASWN